MQKKCLFLLLPALILFCGCHVFRAVRWQGPGLNDADKFPYYTLTPGKDPYHYTYDLHSLNDEKRLFLNEALKGTNTDAFLIIKNDKIIYQYFPKINDSAKAIMGFSLAKSFVGALVGIAIHEKFIKNVNEPITNYLPELSDSDTNFRHTTIQQILDMRSDLATDENKIGINTQMTKMYYGKNINRNLNILKLQTKSHNFEYKNTNTQILSLLIERATKQNFLDYFNSKLWQQLGPYFDAKWLTDDKKHKAPKAYCGLVASVYDFAKLGSLYLHNGYFNNHQIIPAQWVEQSTNPDTLYKYSYKNQIWANAEFLTFDSQDSAIKYKNNHLVTDKILTSNNQYSLKVKSLSFHMEGLFEQTIDIYPNKNLIIIRLGSNPPINGRAMEDIIKESARDL